MNQPDDKCMLAIKLCEKYNIKIVEDAAQGVGVKVDGQHVGTFGDLGILSFYGNKTITCGEGGVILTNNDDLAKRCYQLKNHDRSKKGIFVTKRNEKSLEDTTNYIIENYKKIQKEMNENKLPTKESMIRQISNIIGN